MSTPIAESRGPAGVSIVPILSVNFVGTLGFSIVLPFMVFLVIKWGGNAIVYGVLASTYSFFQLLGAPILGRWSDRYGRRRILLLSQLGTLLSWLIFLTAFTLPADALLEIDSTLLGQFSVTLPLLVLFVARATDGLTGGNVSVANAYLADITDDAHRSADFGRMAMSTNIGFIAGPALAGLLGATVYGEILPVSTALLISFIAALLIGFGLKESKPTTLATNPENANACKVFGQETK
ncbi:MAG: MFS transporter, partial [Gammaproteobacteria bacterium]|nr:MFS transporter [Gammaproteobacteria bacterium]